jgi:protein-tyrosine phosphatase
MALAIAKERIKAHGLGLARHLQVESVGTHAPVPAQRTDPRAAAALERRGYPHVRIRSSRITAKHFATFDEILAMDEQNMAALNKICPAEHRHKLHLLMSYAPQTGRTEIPDPYYSNAQAFELVADLCEAAIAGLLQRYTA